MRRLMLLRHAKSDWSVGGQRDSDRTLAARGRAVAPYMGRYMAAHGLIPDRALVSDAARARETWALVSAEWPTRSAFVYEPGLYEATGKGVIAAVQALAVEPVHTLLVIGHNPALQDAAAQLTGAGDADARYRMMEKFPTAALAVFDFATDDWRMLTPSSGRLDRFVTPAMLRLEAE